MKFNFIRFVWLISLSSILTNCTKNEVQYLQEYFKQIHNFDINTTHSNVLFLYCKHCSNCNQEKLANMKWLPDSSLLIVQSSKSTDEIYMDSFGIKAKKFIDTTDELKKFGLCGAENKLFVVRDGNLLDSYILNSQTLKNLKLKLANKH